MNRFLVASVGAIALFAAQPAAAADMPVKAPPPVVAVWTWDGFYIGGNVGYSWGRSDTDVEYFNAGNGLPIAPPAGSITSQKFNMNGWLAGGQIGFNVQRNNWVFGVEADGQWTGQKGDTSFLCAAVPVTAGVCLPGLTFLPAGVTGTTLSLEEKLQWFVTLRGRVGVLAQPSTLLYVTGGFAFGSVKASGTLGGVLANGTAVAQAFSELGRQCRLDRRRGYRTPALGQLDRQARIPLPGSRNVQLQRLVPRSSGDRRPDQLGRHRPHRSRRPELQVRPDCGGRALLIRNA